MEGLPDPRLLLLWAKRFPTPFSPLSFNLSREIASYLLPCSFLVWMTSNALYFIDLSTSRSSRIQLQSTISANEDSSWVMLISGRIVVCGGSGGVKLAYLLDRKGSVEHLSSMTYNRSAPGIIEWRGEVLVFGSYLGDGVQKCEKLALPSKQWTGLPDLHEDRSYFTPAEWGRAVYLCGGYCFTIERFDGTSMYLLPFKLPQSSRTQTCKQGDSLLILTTNKFITLSNTDSPSIVWEEREPGKFSTNAKPALWREVIYCSLDGKLVKYSAENGQKVS